MTVSDSDLRARFVEFAATARRVPLYRVLSSDPDRLGPALDLLALAPPPQRRPVMLFAAVHHSLLGDPDHPLAGWYRTIVGDRCRDPFEDDPVPAFIDLCRHRRTELEATVATRRVQTNEVGRSALFVVGLGMIGDESIGPLALVDLGTAAGLNLALDRYHYRFSPGGEVGPPSPVVIDCGTRHSPPIPTSLPQIADRIGIDLEPRFDPGADDRRWLQACVWADEVDRARRLAAALDVASTLERRPIVGDLVEGIGPVVEALSTDVHPTVLTSWVLDYLDADRQAEFLARLEHLGSRRDITWIAAESPERVMILGLDPTPITHLVVTRWRDGQRSSVDAARCHPHGAWLHWQGRPLER